jgi:hypothetical protein
MLYIQVRLHSFFFFVSDFFSVFIFLFVVEDESRAANAIAVTPEAKMRATINFFMPLLFSTEKLLQFLYRENYFFMNGKKYLFYQHGLVNLKLKGISGFAIFARPHPDLLLMEKATGAQPSLIQRFSFQWEWVNIDE